MTNVYCRWGSSGRRRQFLLIAKVLSCLMIGKLQADWWDMNETCVPSDMILSIYEIWQISLYRKYHYFPLHVTEKQFRFFFPPLIAKMVSNSILASNEFRSATLWTIQVFGFKGQPFLFSKSSVSNVKGIHSYLRRKNMSIEQDTREQLAWTDNRFEN